MGLLKTLLISS